MFKHGKWAIDIDKNRTKEYYDSLPVINTQSSRNFIINSESFTGEEKEFFDSFCVDLSKVEVEGDLIVSSYLKKKLYWECSGDFIVFGNIVSAPKEEIILVFKSIPLKHLDPPYENKLCALLNKKRLISIASYRIMGMGNMDGQMERC